MIGGSNADGEAITPHFQFLTHAQVTDNIRLSNKIVEFMPKKVGWFGFEEEREVSPTFGMNQKGGMDDIEFEKFIFNSIVPIYPNTADTPGKRVILKVDSGPGRMNPNLLARLRLLGFVLYPGVPNTTSVTQETDQNYGPFKQQFTSNLEMITQHRLNNKLSCSLQP